MSGPRPATAPVVRGMFRRRFRAVADAGRSVAEVEDDHHHMIVTVQHDGAAVTAIEGRMVRNPFDICTGATKLLDRLLGMPLAARPVAPAGVAAKEHCTHLLDIALLAIAQSARGGERRYEFQIPDWIDGRTSPRVIRNGREALQCELLDDAFLGPEPFAGQKARTMLPWAEQTLDDDMLEIVRLLRRSLMVARGRQLNRQGHVSVAIAAQKLGACYTLREERLQSAVPQTNERPLSERPDLFTLPL